MLPKEQQDFINATLGINADELAKAISDEQEVKLELPKGRFLTPEQEESVKDAHGKLRYDAGISKATKEAFDGKSKEEFLNELKLSILEEAKLEPNQKLTEKEKAIELLQNSLKEKETQIERIQREAAEKQQRAEALSSLPKMRDDLGIKPNEALNIIMAGVELKEDTYYKNGSPIVDEYQKPISLNDFLTQEVNTRGWVQAKPQGHGGAGAGKPTTATPKSYDEYLKVLEAKKIKEGSLEANNYLREIRAKNPDFEI